ncbi:MAG: hypothetical protein ACPGYK_09110 [Flavobacteriales bacterium]
MNLKSIKSASYNWAATSLALVFGVNLLIRSWHCTEWIPNGDEPFSLYFAQWSFEGISSVLMNGNNPPVYEWVLHLLQHWNGFNWQRARWISAIWVSIGAMALWGASLKKQGWGAMFSACLFLASTQVMSASHLIRAYALEIGLICLLLWCTETLVTQDDDEKRRPQNRYLGLAWALLVVLVPWVHFYGWLLIIPAILRLDFRKNWKPILLAGLGLAPLILHTANRLASTLDTGVALDQPNGYPMLRDIFLVLNGSSTLTILALVTCIGSLFLSLRKGWGSNPVWLSPLALYGIGSLCTPMYAPRYVALFAPYWCHFLGQSLAFLIQHTSIPFKLRGVSLSTGTMLGLYCSGFILWQTQPQTPVYAPLNNAVKVVPRTTSVAYILAPQYCDLPFARILRPEVFERGALHEKRWSKGDDMNPIDALHADLIESGVQVINAGGQEVQIAEKLLQADTLCLCDCGLWRYPKANIPDIIMDSHPREVFDFQDNSIRLKCFSRY